MRLYKPSYEIYKQGPGIDGIYKAIERAGKTCYKSENTITEDSAEGFVDRMIASKHYAVLEHGTVYLKIPTRYIDISEKLDIPIISDAVLKYQNNPYSKVNLANSDEDVFFSYITTNYRVLVENGWLDDLKYLCEPTEYHEKRVTVRFTTSNSIMREFTRHRSHSFAVESTRYCNYSKDKFNSELTFIIPSWSGLREGSISYFLDLRPMEESLSYTDDRLPIKETYPKMQGILLSWQVAENIYLNSIRYGLTAQQAREVLPLATKCDMVMTGFVSDWIHFFKLRTSIIAETGMPHPDMAVLADPLYKEFIDRKFIEPIE